MADLIFPPSLSPRRVTWTLERNVATYTSPLSYASQRNDQNRSARWRATIEMPPLSADDAALLSTWLDQISRGEHVGLVPVFQNSISGTESAASTFANLQLPWSEPGSLSGWSGTNLLTPARVVDGQVLVFGNGSPPSYIIRTYSVITGAYYEITIDIPLQTGNVRMLLGDGSGASQALAPTMVYGRRSFIFSSTTGALQIYLYSGNDTDVFASAYYGNLKVARIMTVQVTQSAGARFVATWGGQNGALDNFKIGQMVGVQTSRGVELKRIHRAVRQIGSGFNNGLMVNHVGNMTFEPALRGSVSMHAPIVHIDPICRMRLATSESSAVVDAPNFSGFTFDMLEDIAP